MISLCWDALPPVDAVGKLALAGSTNFLTNRRDVETSIHARTLYPARQVTAVVAYPTGGGRARYPIVVAYMEVDYQQSKLAGWTWRNAYVRLREDDAETVGSMHNLVDMVIVQ